MSKQKLFNSSILPVVAIFVGVAAALVSYPNSERMMEYLNFFVWTPEHLSMRLSSYPGLNSMLTAWLLQFFKSAAVGIVLEAGLLALMTWLAALVPKAWGRRSWPMFALIPAVGLVWLFLHKPSVTLEGIYFFGSLAAVGYAYRQCKAWCATVAIAVVGLLSFWFIAFPLTVLLMAALTLLQLTAKKALPSQWSTPKGSRAAHRLSAKPVPILKSRENEVAIVNVILPLLFIAITAVGIKLASDHLGFIPFDKRWWYVPEVKDYVTELLLLMAAPVALMYVPLVGRRTVQTLVTVAASVIVGLCCYNHINDHEGYHVSERVYRYAAMAEKGEWQQMLSDINDNGGTDNTVYLQYALLAEARLGTLADNLFLYPINTPEMFCPRLENTPSACDFCRMFYRELGFPDEAFHQAFQYGMMASPACGFCTGSLRHMAEYSVALGDKPLAEKYLWLLERTSNNSDFVAEQRQLLAKALPLHGGAGRGASSLPLRGDFFVMSTAFNTEMAQHVESDPDNKDALDYLLCGLLLTKRLEIFRVVLNRYADKYKDAPLPKAYAEAAAVVRLLTPTELSPELHYAPEIDAQLKEFNRLHANGLDDSSFRGTFWYYYFYAQIPPQQEWINQSQSS